MSGDTVGAPTRNDAAPDGAWRPRTLPDVLWDPRSDAAVFDFVGRDGEPAMSWRMPELRRRVAQVATALAQRGVRHGDRVAIVLDNSPEYLLALLGAMTAGAVAVPVNTAVRGASLRHMLEQSSPVLALIDPDLRLELAPDLRSLNAARIVDADPGLALFAPADSPSERPASAARPGELACILYTSGTTGLPKGVLCTHGMLIAWARNANHAMDYTPDDVVFIALPMFHSNALCCALIPALVVGASIAVAPSFSASAFWAQIARSRATTVNLLGVMETILRRRGEFPVGSTSLRRVLVIPPPRDAAEFARTFGAPATTLYGLTDAGIPLSVPAGAEAPAGACGCAAPGWECQIVDADDHPVPVGEAGELVIRPLFPDMMSPGYLDAPEATLAAWRNLWFHTGDHMRRDAEGWFSFVGRRSDSLRRGGENVSAYEVEQVLLTHRAVVQAAVFGVPSAVYGEEVMAVLQCDEAGELVLEDVLAHCSRNLPYFAVPRYVRFVESLPMTASAKTDKLLLSREGITLSTIDAGVQKPRRVKA